MTSDKTAADPQMDGPTDEPPALPECYAALELSEGGTLIYEQGTATAWIQSSVARSLDETA